jgi:hypothetical protein
LEDFVFSIILEFEGTGKKTDKIFTYPLFLNSSWRDEYKIEKEPIFIDL